MAKYDLQIKRSAAKEIEALARKDVIAVMDKIRKLADEPRPCDSIKLSGQEKYRIRCGNYRILYQIEDHILTILIVKVAHRKDVYR